MTLGPLCVTRAGEIKEEGSEGSGGAAVINHLWKLPGLAAAGVVSLGVLVVALAAVIAVTLVIAFSVVAAFGVLMSYGLGLIA